MTYREFWALVDEVLGRAQGRVLAQELVLGAVGGRSAQEALDAGVPPRDVWHALCDALEVPDARRWGQDDRRPAPPSR
ncbi:DUF3046 domain-containing protein [Cellulomonas marina]|uniref:DUF3046 domain-containing protein n=1 Tax=Cellulomonas marina TaxID=988821 RepID=A0A1I0VI97_9CELL|nr:DUF3046 domain-containing protein [Cellulomonas marina]GIG27949.1 hypothetical protein Cma02nite_05490 [Cellulomonas marina]SFA76051.1 Protein of unknown function [Cellulomonas marina]